MNVDMQKLRREDIRWQILLTLNNARPNPAWEELVQKVLRATYVDVTELEVRKELNYLESRQLVEIRREPSGRWFCELSRYGVHVAEYTVDCDPGIARPTKYW